MFPAKTVRVDPVAADAKAGVTLASALQYSAEDCDVLSSSSVPTGTDATTPESTVTW